MARPRSNVPRKAKQWAFIPGFTETMTGNGTFATSLFAFTSHQTVIRMLGKYVICPTSAPAALDSATVTVAIALVSSDAASAGAASLPDPSSEPEYPWLYWASHKFFYTSTDPEAGGSAAGVVRDSFDIRSMRTAKPRESLIFVSQYVNVAGNPPLSFACAQTRFLATVH